MLCVPGLCQCHHPQGAGTHGIPWCASCSRQTWAGLKGGREGDKLKQHQGMVVTNRKTVSCTHVQVYIPTMPSLCVTNRSVWVHIQCQYRQLVSPLVVAETRPVGREVISPFPIHLVKFCLNSGVSAPSRTVVTWVHLGYFFCWMKSCRETALMMTSL